MTASNHMLHPVFRSPALADSESEVMNFSGREGINSLFELDVDVRTDRPLDLDSIPGASGEFTLEESDDRVRMRRRGLVSWAEFLGQNHHWFHYRLRLVPRLWRLTQVRRGRVFVDQSPPDFLRETLTSAGLGGRDFEFRLSADYDDRPYVCQYNETDYDFFLRWLEHLGMYYFFDYSESADRLIVTDAPIVHPLIDRDGGVVRFAPPSGLADSVYPETISRMIHRVRKAPGRVVVRDHHYPSPSKTPEGAAVVAGGGPGESYLYGIRCADDGQAERMARTRAEALNAGRAVFKGRSTCPDLVSGALFQLENHPRSDFNRRYLLTRVRYQGRRPTPDEANQPPRPGENGWTAYQNRFQAIAADVPYRPARTVPWPRIHGSLHARIDASGDGQYAEVDDMGRYKVIMPFQPSDGSSGQASKWTRRLQPYTGQSFGFHYPLHKGAEVLVSFVDGNPDRPIITGALPNPDVPSLVTETNQTRCQLTTAGQNKLHFENRDGRQNAWLYSSQTEAGLHLGADAAGSKTGFLFSTRADQTHQIQQNEKVTIGTKSNRLVAGEADMTTLGRRTVTHQKNDTQTHDHDHTTISLGHTSLTYLGSSTEDPPSNSEMVAALEEDHDYAAVNAHNVVLWDVTETSHKGKKDSQARFKFSLDVVKGSLTMTKFSMTDFRIRVLGYTMGTTLAQGRYASLRADFLKTRGQIKGLDVRMAYLYSSTVTTAKQDITGAVVEAMGGKTKLGLKSTGLGLFNLILSPLWTII